MKEKFKFTVNGTIEPKVPETVKDMKELIYDMLSPLEDDLEFGVKIGAIKVVKK